MQERELLTKALLALSQFLEYGGKLHLPSVWRGAVHRKRQERDQAIHQELYALLAMCMLSAFLLQSLCGLASFYAQLR
jgi:hypothetical protein